MAREKIAGLRRLSVFTVLASLALLAAGGWVTSTGSALAVPDWPLSFGSLWPFGRLPAGLPASAKTGVLYEHAHRLLGATVGLLALLQAIWISRLPVSPASRR